MEQYLSEITTILIIIAAIICGHALLITLINKRSRANIIYSAYKMGTIPQKKSIKEIKNDCNKEALCDVNTMIEIYNCCKKMKLFTYHEIKKKLEELINGDEELLNACIARTSSYDYLSMNLATLAVLIAFAGMVLDGDSICNFIANIESIGGLLLAILIVFMPLIIVSGAIWMHCRERKLAYIKHVLTIIEQDLANEKNRKNKE